MIVITKDDEETISEQGILIEVIPVWKWLCSQRLLFSLMEECPNEQQPRF